MFHSNRGWEKINFSACTIDVSEGMPSPVVSKISQDFPKISKAKRLDFETNNTCHAYIYIYIHVCTYILYFILYMYAVYVCIYVYMFTYIYIYYINISIHTHTIHTH